MALLDGEAKAFEACQRAAVQGSRQSAYKRWQRVQTSTGEGRRLEMLKRLGACSPRFDKWSTRVCNLEQVAAE